MSDGGAFGRLLRRLRRERGLTQEALGQAAFCSRDMIKRLEADTRRPSRQTARLLAEALGLDGAEREAFLEAARRAVPPAEQPGDDTLTDPPAAAPRALQAHRRLPNTPTPFIGRARELGELLARLHDPATRLLTLLAPGGMGKTRLALAAAELLAAEGVFADGAAFVDLTPLASSAHLDATAAAALGLPLDLTPQRTPRSQLLDYLREKRLLLVLDNCEHLREGVAELADTLLSDAPGVTLLATSRERLGLRAEALAPLDGMAAETEGPALFAAVAQRIQPAFALDAATHPQMAAICAQLGGMPLAIELAAGWADTLRLSEIAEEVQRGVDLLYTQLSDVPERQRSVRAVWEVTWARLAAEERAAFAQLAVFRGGGTRGALQAVTGAGLDLLRALVGKALLRHGPTQGRYSVHELLRQYAEERLAAEPGAAAAARERHARFYLEGLAADEAALKGGEQRQALDRIGSDFENIIAAWRWAAAAGWADLLAPACHALALFCDWQGRHEEGLEAMTVAATAGDGQALQVLAAGWQGAFLHRLSRRDAALQALDHAERLLAALGSPSALEAFVALQRGDLVMRTDVQAAEAMYTRSIATARACGETWLEAQALAGLGFAYHLLLNDFDEAARCWEACLRLQQALGDQFGSMTTLAELSMNRRYRGLLEDSLALAEQSYELARRIGSPLQQAHAMNHLGSTYTWLGHIELAAPLLEQALRAQADLGNHHRLADLHGRLGYTLLIARRYSEADQHLETALNLSRQTGDTSSEHLALMGLCSAMMSVHVPDYGRQRRAEALRLIQGRGVRHPLVNILLGGAFAERMAGDHAAARRWTVDALREALGYRSWQGVVWAIQSVALLLAREEEPERAVELAALYAREWRREFNRPRNPTERLIFWADLEAVMDKLPAEAIAAARERGARRDLWATGRELLAEFEAAGWGEG